MLAEVCVAVAVALAGVLLLIVQRLRLGGGAAAPAGAARPGGGNKAIPSPFPFWSDMTWVVASTGDFPGETSQGRLRHSPRPWAPPGWYCRYP